MNFELPHIHKSCTVCETILNEELVAEFFFWQTYYRDLQNLVL